MIGAIEDRLVTEIKTALPNKLRKVDQLPGPLNAELLRELVRVAPSVFVAFLGGRQRPRTDPDQVQLDGRFGVYVVTHHASGHHERRRGRGNTAIGAYEILDAILPRLAGVTVDGAGTVALVNVENLFSVRLQKEYAATLYAAVFAVPVPMDAPLDLSTLDDFAIYHAEHSLVAGEDEPDAIDNVNMPQ